MVNPRRLGPYVGLLPLIFGRQVARWYPDKVHIQSDPNLGLLRTRQR